MRERSERVDFLRIRPPRDPQNPEKSRCAAPFPGKREPDASLVGAGARLDPRAGARSAPALGMVNNNDKPPPLFYYSTNYISTRDET